MSISSRNLAATLLATLSVVSSHAADVSLTGPVIDQIRVQGRIVLAHRESAIPFSFKGADGQPMGYALDICHRLVTGDLESAVQMVERGEVDALAMDDVLLFGLAANRPDPKALKIVGRFMTTEPLAIMLPKSDAAFKRIVDDEMRRLIYSREIHADYDRWFMRPIPPKNVSLNLSVSYLLRDFWKYPTDQVP